MNYTEEDMMKARNSGFEECQKHSQPSPMTIKMFEDMNQEIRDLQKDIKDLISEVSGMRGELTEFKIGANNVYKRAKKNTNRITRLEIAMGKITIKVAIVIGAITTGLYFLIDWLKKFFIK